MIVRPARAEDIPALATVAERSYRAAFAGILEREGVAEGRNAAFFAERFASSGTHAGRSPMTSSSASCS